MEEPVAYTPEYVAFRLMQRIAAVEGKTLQRRRTANANRTVADRNWILNTYAECIACVKGTRAPR